MLQTIELYFLVFMIYSILGWCIEVITKLVETKKFINRGFLIGPYLPIYGFGAIVITLLLQRYENDLIVLFIFSILICSILEYFTSFIMEKIFCTRWWDYSTKKFNINGRICLRTMIPFGLLGVIMIKYINPLLINVCKSYNSFSLNIVFAITLLVFMLDIIVSSVILLSFRKENKLLVGDNTEKMSKKVYSKIKKLGWPYKRLLKAFPNLRHISKIIDNSRKKALDYINKTRKKYMKKEQRLIEKSENALEKYNEKIEKVRKKSDRAISKMNRKR